MSQIYLNGQIISQEEAKISIFDRGLLYGDGIFESIRTYSRKIFKLDEHLNRLYETAELINIKIPLPKSQLKEAINKIVEINGFKESYIKVLVTRGEAAAFGLNPKNVVSLPTILIYVKDLKPYPPETYTKGWKVVISKIKRGDTVSNIKSLNYLNNVLAKIEANQAGAQEAIILTSEGYVAEGTVSNFFIVKSQTLITPPLSIGILKGITRDIVFELAKDLNIKVEETLFTKEELYKAEECFLTFTGAGIVPLVQIDSQMLGDGKPGIITQKIMKAFGEYTKY